MYHDPGTVQSVCCVNVGSMDTNTVAREFFDTYAKALLARDAPVIANAYAVPALIVGPDQVIAVSDRAQTEEFFASAFGQYDGVTEARADVGVVAQSSHSLWVDVRWTYDNAPAERNMYQLIRAGETWQIAVLTPMTE